jgi:hypothetical protein
MKQVLVVGDFFGLFTETIHEELRRIEEELARLGQPTHLALVSTRSQQTALKLLADCIPGLTLIVVCARLASDDALYATADATVAFAASVYRLLGDMPIIAMSSTPPSSDESRLLAAAELRYVELRGVDTILGQVLLPAAARPPRRL